jgi:hypothetical protein
MLSTMVRTAARPPYYTEALSCLRTKNLGSSQGMLTSISRLYPHCVSCRPAIGFDKLFSDQHNYLGCFISSVSAWHADRTWHLVGLGRKAPIRSWKSFDTWIMLGNDVDSICAAMFTAEPNTCDRLVTENAVSARLTGVQ